MPRKIGSSKSVQISVTLPAEAIELMMRLGGSGYFPSSRGEVARDLILAKLRDLGAPNIADVLASKKKKKARHR